MSTLAELRTRVRLWLHDSSSIAWTDAEIDDALRQALDEYSQALPLWTEQVITLPADGREIALNGLEGLIGVLEVWWPFDSDAAETWPPKRVQGWTLAWDDAQPVLTLTARAGPQPQQNDEVRIWYARKHAIQNLDLADATTLPVLDEGTLVEGAAGFAALGLALDRSEVLDREHLRRWGELRVADFRAALERRRHGEARSTGEPWGTGWRLDKWE